MKDAINLFYDDYVKALNNTKKHCLKLNESMNNINDKLNNKNEYFDSGVFLELELFGLKGLQYKLISSTYVLVDAYVKLIGVHDSLDEKQQKNIKEYNKVLNLVKNTIEKTSHFIEDISPSNDKNL